jgi:hypothetical protein
MSVTLHQNRTIFVNNQFQGASTGAGNVAEQIETVNPATEEV